MRPRRRRYPCRRENQPAGTASMSRGLFSSGLAVKSRITGCGMDEPVGDEAAKVFAAQFYNALAFGKSLRDAFEQAKLQVVLATGSPSGTPQLHTAPGLDAADVYLVRPAETDAASRGGGAG
jgi:hypothetical protein